VISPSWGVDSRQSPVKIVFRLNYHTVLGQSLWLKVAVVLGTQPVRFEQTVPLRWINDRQWEGIVEVGGAGQFQLEYSYQLRQQTNGVELDEWRPVREVTVDLDALGSLVLLDAWRSAGTIDYAFESKAFRLPMAGQAVTQIEVPKEADHVFQLRMAAVPTGKVPCLIGSVSALGNWGWHSAVPLIEVAPNLWQASLQLPAGADVEYKYGLFDPALGCVVSLELGENRHLAPHEYHDRQLTRVNDECYRRDASGFFRGTGVAIPVFALRGKDSFGVGEFADLKALGDWSVTVGLKMIQILPVNDTTSSHDWTDSYPYSAISVFALNPLYLRLTDLPYAMSAAFQREVTQTAQRLDALPQYDHAAVMQEKRRLTREIFDQHRTAILGNREFLQFLTEHGDWLIPYAVFSRKRDQYGTSDFSCWGDGWSEFDLARVTALAEAAHPEWPEIAYHLWLQWELDRQFSDAAGYLRALGVVLKGDLPIGIDRQSVDAWSMPQLFKMEAQAGAPPDPFAVKGQNWGFPTYDWDVMKRDGYGWWRARFNHLSRYFDVYRIDHILGFFRIWQIPQEHLEGIMGYFDPALPIQLHEFYERGIPFDYNRYCRPYIRWDALCERFGEAAGYVKEKFLHECEDGYFQLREEVLTQRRIDEWFDQNRHEESIRQGLLDCAAEVLFFEVPGSNGSQFHPRMSMQSTHSYRDLDPEIRWRVEELYNNYFFGRQDEFWQSQGYAKLPAMRHASDMLLCGEDLGMVPACVPGVLRELGILSLEIQRMPKTHEVEFFNPLHAPYLSVVSPSTHDMSPLRGWWKEDAQTTSRFAWQMLGIAFPEAELSGEVAAQILAQHLHSPAMWAVFPLQDLMAIDETLRHPVPEAERINIPAIVPHRWCYRMHLNLAELGRAQHFNDRLRRMIQGAGRSAGI
jgi:4-alpha-glucanotransferase